MTNRNLEKRPAAVSVTAAFLFAACAIALVSGASLLFPGTPLDRLWELNRRGHAALEGFGRAPGAMLIALAVALAFAAPALLKGRPWAWRFAVGIFLANGVGDVVSYRWTHDAARSIAGLVIASVFLVSLNRRPVRTFFGLATV